MICLLTVLIFSTRGDYYRVMSVGNVIPLVTISHIEDWNKKIRLVDICMPEARFSVVDDALAHNPNQSLGTT
jgi:hypothetical protein